MINEKQKLIVEDAKYPAAVLAGPGTGKTFTIVQKIISLIKNDGISPNKILVTTFTKKAANELIERVESGLKKENIFADTSNMLIGNFHSLALSFLKEYKSFTNKIFDPLVIDSHIEGYLIEKNMDIFENISNFSKFISYNEVGQIQGIFANITNNLLCLDELRNSSNPRDILALEIYLKWANFLDENDLINYQLILKKFYDLLKDPFYGKKIRDRIDFVIIDEYQDTNTIQEEISFSLCKGKNLMVFGDDDQALYSFRGASPKNLRDFDKTCKMKMKRKANFYHLDINYRSNQEIIDKSREFLVNSKAFDLEKIKNLRANDGEKNENSVVRARANEYENIENIVKFLNKKINLNQIAFLFPSLNSDYPKSLQTYFENHGINVLNKSSKLFFKRREIRLCLYVLISIFSKKPKKLTGSNPDKYKWTQETNFKKYLASIFDDKEFTKNEELNAFIKEEKLNIEENKSYTDILYKAFGLEIFREILDKKIDKLNSIRQLSNIGKFTSILSDFTNLCGYDINYYKKSVDLIYGYIFYLFKNSAISEFENFDAPKNSVIFSTIHQAKGLEYDVVFVSSLNDNPRKDMRAFSPKLEAKKESDFLKNYYRKYYTAFTRAKNLLVLLDNSKNSYLKNFAFSLNSSSILKTIDFKFKEDIVKKEILAYTTDISIYKSCPLKYKFIRVLDFKKEKSKSLEFGSKVHSLTEYLTNLKKENLSYHAINDFIKENKEFQKPIENFVNRNFPIKYSEMNIKLDRFSYILQGNIDIILEDGTIIDIKTGKVDENNLISYKNQLLTYYNLLVYNNKKVNKMILYFIEEDKLIEVEKSDFDMKNIDEIGKNIVEKNIEIKTQDKRQCKFCPMAHFCKRT
ncbi:ATP-dependent helicase [Anaerococcus vaginalis]|uniref:DNA 3'-5' helicase n=2 Tax=Anaerococcus vaginalis TaxID=33037 RepID=C7HRX0_9FIRM|nr:ATP-dependent DNA helicase [Anaerococcus vaginalis]EEU13539.1 UvrD/REP helicase [Anaerococcus vaginalis ATCC 51170]QQB62112.1 ATP-dependent helicase [Anaerococcus vaginalis]